MISNYEKYRGKCKEMCEELVEQNPSYQIIRGHYYCPIWNTEEPHWWCIDEAGNVVDPTSKQFPSNGLGDYIPFDGMVSCCQCEKEMTETWAKENGYFHGNYVTCSDSCMLRLVGL